MAKVLSMTFHYTSLPGQKAAPLLKCAKLVRASREDEEQEFSTQRPLFRGNIRCSTRCLTLASF